MTTTSGADVGQRPRDYKNTKMADFADTSARLSSLTS